ncbi:MAG: alanine--tRNA ligase [Myxococcota bacterium]|nr:alanine--tRNA ligase [Myxococcota bacterium]
MTIKTTIELRQAFLDYFARQNHAIVKSSPLIPANDPTLMFVNAGMVQFKDLFVGREKRAYSRATTSQKCLRVSGKHNDLEQVGRTNRHHTFFEMLGNFSFGDYFKEEAIHFAWEFLTKELQVPKDKLWVTVFEGTSDIPPDAEAKSLWKKISGLSDHRIIEMGMKDNFWMMGDTGPCGPCTEIHFDTETGSDPTPDDFENGRVIEIWNNVFMQFERSADGLLNPLPAPSVDTGMGLERLAAVISGFNTNYDTDAFKELIHKTSELVGKKYQSSNAEDDVSMRVIADHARTSAFLIADGLQPSNEGRGYVMRRIMRRAIRHGHRLGFDKLFLSKICKDVVEQLSPVYPELKEASSLIQKVVDLEEQNFRRTMDSGLRILSEEIRHLPDGEKTLSGETIFKLYDTYGFPKDLTELIASEHSLSIDHAGFDAAMEQQRSRSRNSKIGEEAVADVYMEIAQNLGQISFVGYPDEQVPLAERSGEWQIFEVDGIEYLTTKTQIKSIIQRNQETENSQPGSIEVVLNPTPFYGESGGQLGDRGMIFDLDGKPIVTISESRKPISELTVGRGETNTENLRPDDHVWAGYAVHERRQLRAHHSATHLLHEALRDVLGNHVAQAGSLVESSRLRFDYSHFESTPFESLEHVEAIVNKAVQARLPVSTDILPFEKAKEKGAMALFGEKYGDLVRIITMGNSIEFCGGTHVNNTKDIELLLIQKEEAIASGVRRIEAEVGDAAQKRILSLHKKLQELQKYLENPTHDQPLHSDTIVTAVRNLMQNYQERKTKLEKIGTTPQSANYETTPFPQSEKFAFPEAKEIRNTWVALTRLMNGQDFGDVQLKTDTSRNFLGAVQTIQKTNRANEKLERQNQSSELNSLADKLLGEAKQVHNYQLIMVELGEIPSKDMRELADGLRSKLSKSVICLTSQNDGKLGLLIGVTKDAMKTFNAGKMMKEFAPIVGGRGGGKPDLAQGGGTTPEKTKNLFEAVEGFVKEKASTTD